MHFLIASYFEDFDWAILKNVENNLTKEQKM